MHSRSDAPAGAWGEPEALDAIQAETVDEARRLMEICNACRYCEGFCAVFPAMARRTVFDAQDLVQLANLCHDCRACYYACQYAPPHEFAINVPQAFAQLRRESYASSAYPPGMAKLFERNGLAVAVACILATLLVLGLTTALVGPAAVFAPHTGPGAFYRVISYGLMVGPASVLAILALVVLVASSGRFWQRNGGSRAWREGADSRRFWAALRIAGANAARLTHLKGGGDGCNYPEEAFSHRRRWFHHMVLYGFLLDFASTTVAAVYDHFLDLPAPYPLLSIPVVLGTLGGAGLLVGTAGLLVLRRMSDRAPSERSVQGMDLAFLWLLFFTALSGLLLLVLRETSAMGSLLALHLGLVAGLFLTLPYSKFVHGAYRYLALFRDALEEAAERSQPVA